MEGAEFCSSYMHVQFKYCDYAGGSQFKTSAVLLLWVVENHKSAMSEKVDNIGLHEVLCYLHLKGSCKELHEGRSHF